MTRRVRIEDSIPDDVTAILIVGRVRDGFKPSEGSSITFCHRCKEDCWIGPTALENLHKVKEVICVACLLEEDPDAIAEMLENPIVLAGTKEELAKMIEEEEGKR